jgi:epoxyqueuosine reductase
VKPFEKAEAVKRRALELGFEAVGITDLSPTLHEFELGVWLKSGMAGTMTYMHRQAAKRARPAMILPGADRAIVLCANYFNAEGDPPGAAGRVAKYARGHDYHESLVGPLQALVNFVKSMGNCDTVARFYVDAGPVPERELAQRAGIGWIGKNTMLISPTRGSFTFLATVLTNLDVQIDDPFAMDRCGSCTRCLDACPTNAFPSARVLDSRQCISYLTIEYKGEIARELKTLMQDWIFGCDVCQDVCPWNSKFATPTEGKLLELDPSRAFVDLAMLIEMNEAEFVEQFGWTPLERPGSAGMKRNAKIALENSRKEASWQMSQTQ